MKLYLENKARLILMKVRFNRETSLLWLVLMALIRLSCSVQDLILGTVSWHKDSMENFILLRAKRVPQGTGQLIGSPEINSLNGFSMQKTVIFMWFTCLWVKKLEQSIMRQLRKNSSSPVRVFLMDNTISCQFGLIPLHKISQDHFLQLYFL